MARFRIEQLNKALSQKISPVYIVTGDEPLLVQEACDLIRQKARAAGFIERELYHADSGFNWETLLQNANSLSLFAERKILEVRIHNGKPGDAGTKALMEYCRAPSEDNLLLLILPKIDKRTQNTKWFKTIEQAADTIQIWPVTAQQLPRWIEQRLSAAGLSADPQAIDILCTKIEGNLLAAVQEVEKLKLLAETSHLDAQLMSNAVMDSARYDVFSLVNKALAGDSRSAVANLQGLRTEGTEPPVILWALAREIRTLTGIKEAQQLGQNFDLSAKKHGVWDNRKSVIKQALNRIELRQLHILIRKCGLADKAIKGVVKADAWNILLDITLGLAGTQSLSAKSTKASLQ